MLQNTPKIHHTETLSCGIRLICAPSSSDVAYCGIAIDAGTRDEMEMEGGLAHFCEHLTFKGTHRRRSWHILNRMETVGGDLNAYTGKEETIYYSAFLKEHFSRAVDLLTDIVLGSTYPQTEMNKEVEVVIDEIESYNDSPSELIFDEFENLIFSGHPIGRNILGEAERLREFRTEDVQRFADRLYTLHNMVFFVYGKITPKIVRRELEKALINPQSINVDTECFTQTLTSFDMNNIRSNPNDFVLYGDSWNTTYNKQISTFTHAKNSTSHFYEAHNGYINGSYLDGHAEAKGGHDFMNSWAQEMVLHNKAATSPSSYQTAAWFDKNKTEKYDNFFEK